MDFDNPRALMAVSLAAALAVFSPRGTLAVRWGDEPVDVASIQVPVALPFDTTVGHPAEPSACASRMQELMMQYGGDGIVLADLEAACAASPPPPVQPTTQD